MSTVETKWNIIGIYIDLLVGIPRVSCRIGKGRWSLAYSVGCLQYIHGVVYLFPRIMRWTDLITT